MPAVGPDGTKLATVKPIGLSAQEAITAGNGIDWVIITEMTVLSVSITNASAVGGSVTVEVRRSGVDTVLTLDAISVGAGTTVYETYRIAGLEQARLSAVSADLTVLLMASTV